MGPSDVEVDVEVGEADVNDAETAEAEEAEAAAADAEDADAAEADDMDETTESKNVVSMLRNSEREYGRGRMKTEVKARTDGGERGLREVRVRE